MIANEDSLPNPFDNIKCTHLQPRPQPLPLHEQWYPLGTCMLRDLERRLGQPPIKVDERSTVYGSVQLGRRELIRVQVGAGGVDAGAGAPWCDGAQW